MARPESELTQRPRALPALRWWIGGLLFASTVINYVDRQTLSNLAPFLKEEYHWTNEDFAMILIAFRVAYCVGQTLSGRLLDLVGTRLGLTISVAWYSTVAAMTSLATGLYSFIGFRFLLGLGESANWPGATKAVAEWFPKRERGWAVALFDSGSSIGGAVAPALVLFFYMKFGWRSTFLITGSLGFLWLLAWRWLYYPPESHPRLSAAERDMILADRQDESSVALPSGTTTGAAPRWRDLLALRQTWGVIAARSFTDPVWFFITDWFVIYLKAKGFQIADALFCVWIPFIAADLGNFAGGGASSWLIRRGWDVGRARKAVIVLGALGVLLLIPASYAVSMPAIAALVAVVTFGYAAFSTMALVLPSDLYESRAVATVSGLSGTGSGVAAIGSTYLIGYVADHYSFDTILLAGSVVPLIGAAIVLALVRNTDQSGKGIVRTI